MLIEILVSALILTIASAAVVTVMAASVGTAGEQRHGSEAYALAQQDQSRLATMRLGRLNHLEEARPVTLNGTTFEVHSAGLWISNETAKQLCTETAASSTDYVQLTSEVTWPGMDAGEKAKIMSILSPSGSQSVDTSLGKLPIKVSNEQGAPIPGVVLTGSQLEGVGGHFSGRTDASGCATFPELPVGTAAKPARNYTVVADGSQAGVINKDGKTSETVTGAAAAPSELPKILSFRFDHPGTIPIKFKYRVGSTSTFEPATAESLVFINTGMTLRRVFWTTSGLRETTVSASNLFPFSSPYSIFAGSCEGNEPKAGAEAAMASVVAPAGGTATPATIQLPALNLTVLNGTTPFKGAKVTITDKTCKDSKGAALKWVYTTNKTGNQAATAEGPTEPWLPYGSYEICASGELKAGETKKVTVSSLPVQTLASATTQEINLAKGVAGVCT